MTIILLTSFIILSLFSFTIILLCRIKNKKIKYLLLLSGLVFILGTLAELTTFNVLSWIPYFNREIWHLLCFSCGAIWTYFFLTSCPKSNKTIIFWLVISGSLIIAIYVELVSSSPQALFFSLEKFGHMIINVLGLGVFILIYHQILKNN